MNSQPWAQEAPDVLSAYGTASQLGLTQEQLLLASQKFGKNNLKSEKKISKLTLLLKQFKSPMVYTLLVATIVSAFLGDSIDALAILAIVILNALIGFGQEARAEESIEALKSLSVPKARVKRDGMVKIIDSQDVVPGDLIVLEAGDYVVADGRIIQGFQLAADEAILTGESMPVEKNQVRIASEAPLAERSNMLFASTAISKGSGEMIVTATGMNTQIGHIAGLLGQAKVKETPLQERMGKLSNLLILMGAGVIVIVGLIGFSKGTAWSEIFMNAISLAVATIPEGLPTVVTLALALAVRRMSKRNAIVRKMPAVETLGSTDVICTDKTGTLTTGKMRVRETYTLDNQQDEIFYQILVKCNNASLDHGGSGDPTEIALLYLADEAGTLDAVKAGSNRIHEWSFESDRKRMSVAIKSHNEFLILTKGAPETLLPLCLLTDEERSRISERINTLSMKGHRILALAYKKIDDLSSKEKQNPGLIERELTFKGLVAIADPPKEETIPAIKSCKAAGIKVVMITGDHPLTASAIAHELGITEEGIFDEVLSGADLEKMSQDELKIRAEKTAVYARVSPEHKLQIIKALESNGHVVSMTGDGVNDAPALKSAAIGVAMGKAGTEVARQASSMILTDDNFSTIVSAVEEGRALYGNIKRTIQYLLSTNLAELLIMVGAVLIGLPVPLHPLNLLWINLVTDGLPSLALAAEPVGKDYLKTSTRPSPSSFFDRPFYLELFFVGILSTILGLIIYDYSIQHYDLLTSRSYMFNFMVYLCLFRSFSCRSETKTFFELSFNPIHLGAVLAPVILQASLQYSGLFQSLFKVRAVTLTENGILIGISLIPVTFVEVYKLINKKRKKTEEF